MDESSGRGPIDESRSFGAHDDDATRVMPSEEATRILEGEEATRAIGGATQTAAPPPPPPTPRLVMQSPSGPRRWWWLIVLLLVAAVALAAVWYFIAADGDTPSPTPSPTSDGFAWAGAWARVDGSGGGLVIEGDDGAYTVTAYDEALRSPATAGATGGEDDEGLRFTLPAAVSFGAAGELVEGIVTAGEDADSATLSVMRDDGTTLNVPLRRVPALTASLPTPSPTPSASPSPSPSASSSPDTELQRQQMIAAVERIQAGIEEWAANNGGVFPMPADVRDGYAVAAFVNPWPLNPYVANQPLMPGTTAGNYTYEQLDGGGAYVLTGYLDNGTFVVP